MTVTSWTATLASPPTWTSTAIALPPAAAIVPADCTDALPWLLLAETVRTKSPRVAASPTPMVASPLPLLAEMPLAPLASPALAPLDRVEASGIPHLQVSTEEVSGPQGLEAFRQSVQDLFALMPLSAEDYRIDLIAWHLGTLMLGTFRSSALAFDRPASLVAASGLDHLLVQLHVEGGFTGVADRESIVVAPGDILVFDLTRTLHTRASDFGNISLLIPRAFFAATHAEVSALHGRVLPAGGAFTGVLASYMIALAERIPALDAREGDLAAKSTAALITTVLASHDDRGPAAAAVIQSPFRKISQEIERRLRDPALDADAWGDALGMSRASLYRAFEPVGGIAERGASAQRPALANLVRRQETHRQLGFRTLNAHAMRLTQICAMKERRHRLHTRRPAQLPPFVAAPASRSMPEAKAALHSVCNIPA